MLRIAMLTDYAFVVLGYMAQHRHVCVHRARELAEATQLPGPTVAKICRTLARGGLLDSSRGAQGGYVFARPPEEISLVDVVEAMEGPVSLTRCATPHDGPCSHQSNCALGGSWPLINRAVRDALANVSLAEALEPHGLRRRVHDPQTAESSQ